jgi:hypothetical protein
MCDHLILNGARYICNDCYEELLNYRESWPNEMVKLEIKERIEVFMNETTPGTYSPELDYNGIQEEFDRLTQDSSSVEKL